MCSNKETLESPTPATRFAFFYPSLYCFYFAMIVFFASYLFVAFLFEFIFETIEDNVWFKCGGGEG